jgi:hypothetical protein
MYQANKKNRKESGQLLVLVLVFGAIFLIIISSFISSIIAQSKVVDFRFEQQRATEIAEAGLNYYKWYLGHFPGDTSGGGVYRYTDLEDSEIGTYELVVTSNSYCGQVASLEVTSTGYTDANPVARAIISASYKRPTVAEYAFINNAGIRYGSTRVITGPVHGNQGVRMDGSHNSFVGAGVSTYEGNGGVYTTTALATPGLFQFPISPIDFTGLTIDLAQMRTSAQSDGIYYGPTAEDGYRLVFNGDGTADIFEVTQTTNYWAYSSAEGWHQGERNDVANDNQIANDVVIDVNCPVLFFEDKLWVEGDVSQKVAVGVGLNTTANPYSGVPNAQNNIVIHNSLQYAVGTDAGLVAIAQQDVDVGIEVQTDMIADGIFIAQSGRFGRNHYVTSGSRGLPGALDPFVSRDSLTRTGSVVSNLGGGTEWTSSGSHISGFRSRITSFDRDQIDDPPPLVPTTNDVYDLQNWRQEG